MIRAMRWQDSGNDDPRFPPAFVIEFDAGASLSVESERNEIALPAKLQKAVLTRQAEFLMGRLAARYAIERLGIVASIPAIGPSREPVWQAGVTGSITHTNDMAGAIAVVSSTVNGIGIDIERVIDADSLAALRELVVTSDEEALLEARRGHLSIRTLLTIAFSAKESFFKAVFACVGRYFEFDAVRLSSLDVQANRLTLTLRETLCPALIEGRSFTACFSLLSSDTVMTSLIW